MNLRRVGDYNIGLDIGTGSVGWAVTDADGKLCHFNKKPTWGSRLFPSASTAAETRKHRGQRRRYNRRRWRLNLLQKIFEPEIESVDPDFFIRLKQSSLFPEDRDTSHADYLYTLFNDSSFDEKAYFRKFPTIYHLRSWLMTTDEAADIRLIYLAMHNIVKHRGSFLQQDNKSLSSQNANVDDSVKRFCVDLQAYCDELDIPCSVMDNEESIIAALSDISSSRSHVQDQVSSLLGIKACDILPKSAEAKAMAKSLAASLVGLSTDVTKIFFLIEEPPEGITSKIYLSNDDQVVEFEESCPDNALSLFRAMKAVYSSYVLQEILSSVPGKSLSINKIRDYEVYHDNLKLLKDLVRQYVPDEFDQFFRGELYPATEFHPQKNVYDKAKAQGYTKYNEVRKWPYGDFRKSVEKLFSGTEATDDPRYIDMMDRFNNEKFLRRLKTSDNGAIPFQLHLEELDEIIENQGKHYPFLVKERRELDSLVTFRIPYYVGPLTHKNSRRKNDKSDGENRFAWSVRQEGKEAEKIYPWNWEEVIDKDASAEKFINRMNGTCTYLQGEPVLPKSSLLYEEYCVLNELNGASFSQDGDSWTRFDYKDRTDIIEDLFKRKKVSYKDVATWMKRERNHQNIRVRGGQGEAGFESKLGSYIFFAKDVFHVDEIPEVYYPMIEEIILWSTLFEDRAIFKDKLKKKYGDRFTSDQINKIVKKRFSGWGRLSRELLTGLKSDTDNGPKSIIEILREGNPNNNGLSKPMVFMEIMHDDHFTFEEQVNKYNKERLLGTEGLAIDELPGSPALRRGINQALRIVDEIVKVAGHAPCNIFIEVTRNEDVKSKGKRTRRRYDSLSEAMRALKEEAPELWDEHVSKALSARRNMDFDERLTLYFMQNGKSLYSGKPLDIGRLSEYEVDHIIPQSYIKDDSFENKALVLRSENQNKSDQMLVPADVRKRMKGYWKALFDARLIGEKKYRNLMQSEVSERRLKGFIARQLVETSQIVKIVQELLSQKYTGTTILPVKAALSSELRNYGRGKTGEALFPKCREVNDFHHAHDALLASEIGRFILKRHEGMYSNPIGYTYVMKDFVRRESELARKGSLPGETSFIIKSFMRSGFDEETGELFKDDWSASEEIDRLKKYFNYRQCFVSRMPQEESGAFWDQTVYSPRDASNKGVLPLKQGLDPRKYGNYSSEQYAYFFIFEAKKGGKRQLLFSPLPINIAVRIKSGELTISDYASGLAAKDGLEFVGVVLPRIFKYQLIKIDGSYLYITGREEVRNGVEIALDQNDVRIVARIVDEKEAGAVDDADLLRVFESIRESLAVYSQRLAGNIKLDEWANIVRGLPNEEKESLILGLLAIASAKKNSVDLICVGRSKTSGQLKVNFSKELTKGNGITFIDQSVTGMFERLTHVGL